MLRHDYLWITALTLNTHYLHWALPQLERKARRMKFTTLVSSLYGELRGYHRLGIRRRVQANERLSFEEMRVLTSRLFEIRVRDAIDRFPEYADKVRAFRGSLPGENEPVPPEELPVWTRRDQRAVFAAQERPGDSAYVHQTSGSTSLPVTFHVTRDSYEWRSAVTDRGYRWGGAEEGSKSFFLWAGAHGSSPLFARIKKKVHNALQRRVFYDVFQQMGDRENAECCDQINRFRPNAIIGYTSMLVDLARFARDNPGALRWKARTLVTAAEGLQTGQRKLLTDSLVDEVFLSYGSREFMGVGMECGRHNGYHIHTDNVVVEVVDDTGRPAPAGESGRIVITDLRNLATPFIRYEIGDFGTMADTGPGGACSCGLPFPLLKSVDGRLQDVIYTSGGGKVTGLYITYVMRQFDWIEGYQVVQDNRESILVKLLTGRELTPDATSGIDALLREKLGAEMRIDYERVDELTRRASGKIQLVVSSIGEG
jgi:phenylacetate-CoA ligase